MVVRALGGLVALLALGGGLLLLAPGPRSTAVGQVDQVDDANMLEQGRELYLTTCASCHGQTGEGSDYAPDIRNAGPAGNDFFLRTGRMPLAELGTAPWEQEPQLSEEQIEALVAYASTLGEGPQIPTVVAELGDVQRGWELYINNCAACHGAGGGGGGIGGGVVAPPLSRADPLTVAEAMLIGPGAMPHFAFREEDVNAIAAYVERLRAEPSPGGVPLAGLGPVPEGFIAALFGVGSLLLIARWIARRAEFEPVGNGTLASEETAPAADDRGPEPAS